MVLVTTVVFWYLYVIMIVILILQNAPLMLTLMFVLTPNILDDNITLKHLNKINYCDVILFCKFTLVTHDRDITNDNK